MLVAEEGVAEEGVAEEGLAVGSTGGSGDCFLRRGGAAAVFTLPAVISRAQL